MEENRQVENIEKNIKPEEIITESVQTEVISEKQRRKEKRAAKREERRRKEAEKSFAQNVFETVAYAAIALCVALIVKNWIGQPIIVDGESMTDTLSNHDWVWANKVGYTPERFDVVILKPYSDSKEYYIKRVLGLPGETIFIDEDDKIWITPADGGEKYQLEDPYGYFSGMVLVKVINYPNNPDGSYTLGEKEYFCIGDNRYNSKDSRILGGFDRSQIKGHAVFRLFPFTKIGDFDKSNEK